MVFMTVLTGTFAQQKSTFVIFENRRHEDIERNCELFVKQLLYAFSLLARQQCVRIILLPAMQFPSRVTGDNGVLLHKVDGAKRRPEPGYVSYRVAQSNASMDGFSILRSDQPEM